MVILKKKCMIYNTIDIANPWSGFSVKCFCSYPKIICFDLSAMIGESLSYNLAIHQPLSSNQMLDTKQEMPGIEGLFFTVSDLKGRSAYTTRTIFLP